MFFEILLYDYFNCPAVTVRGTYNHKFEWGNLKNAKAFFLQKTPYFLSTGFVEKKKIPQNVTITFLKFNFLEN